MPSQERPALTLLPARFLASGLAPKARAIDKLNHVEPPLATFVLGNERASGQRPLAHPRRMSHCDKKLDHAGIFRGRGTFPWPPG